MQRRHENRTESQSGGMQRCPQGRYAPFGLLLGKLYNQDTVLCSHAHEHHQAHLKVDIIFKPAYPLAQICPKSRHSSESITAAGTVQLS